MHHPRPGPVSAFLSSRGDASVPSPHPHRSRPYEWDERRKRPIPTSIPLPPLRMGRVAPNYLHVKVGSRGVENDMKAEFDDEQGMFEERAAQRAGVGQTFADAEQEYFEIGTDWSKRSEEGIIARNSFSAFPSRTC